MTNFDLSGLPDPPPPPPIDPIVAREEKIANDTRVESELNRFIAAKQDALFEAPDAYFRRQGRDAVDSAPQAIQDLHDTKQNLLNSLANDYQRKRLGDALDAQMVLARDDISRHVAEQSRVWQRQVASNRIDLLSKEAALHRDDDDLVDALSEAASNAARAHERAGGAELLPSVEERAAAAARSRTLMSALQAHIDAGDIEGASKFFDRVQDRLVADHAKSASDQISPPRQIEDVDIATSFDKAYSECVSECSRKYAQGALPRPTWFSGSDIPSLMRLCIRTCLAEKGDHNY